jgi:hypothetical protein
LDAYSNLYWVPFTAFNEQLAILQRIATTGQVLYRGAKTSERNQLIDSGMPPFGGLRQSQAVYGQHAQLATAENLTTRSILTAWIIRIFQIQFYIKSHFLTGDFRMLKTR